MEVGDVHVVRLIAATLFEVAIAGGWLLTLLWILAVHLAWLLPMLPLCSPIG